MMQEGVQTVRRQFLRATYKRATVEALTGWDLVYHVALSCSGKESVLPPPPEKFSAWIEKIIGAGHSPIYAKLYLVKLSGIPSWVSVHFVRHHVGVVHFVQSQRPDRTHSGLSRHDLRQDAPVNHVMVLNAAAVISISHRRLCSQAAEETRETWKEVLSALDMMGEKELLKYCVPTCEACGGVCHEFKSCKHCEDLKFYGGCPHDSD